MSFYSDGFWLEWSIGLSADQMFKIEKKVLFIAESETEAASQVQLAKIYASTLKLKAHRSIQQG